MKNIWNIFMENEKFEMHRTGHTLCFVMQAVFVFLTVRSGYCFCISKKNLLFSTI